ncbi:MAG: hypothetical protein ABL940_08235 [Bacteroidia bacterium]
MSKLITELKQGDKIYDVDYRQVRWYKYHCIHPIGSGNYHILIDECEQPIRVYKEILQAILDKNLKTRKEAKLVLANKFEATAKRLREEL